MITVLMALSGIFWMIVYIDGIRIGFRDKTYCMPLFALALNITWEALYLCDEIFVLKIVNVQLFSKIAWLCLDIPLLITYLKYGKKECRSGLEKKAFIPSAVFALSVSAVLQLAFYKEFGSVYGDLFSSFLQNLLMSVIFIVLLFRRQSTKGQSMLIAVSKCIGTLTPTIALGLLEKQSFILDIGILIFITDVIYIFLLSYTSGQEKNSLL